MSKLKLNKAIFHMKDVRDCVLDVELTITAGIACANIYFEKHLIYYTRIPFQDLQNSDLRNVNLIAERFVNDSEHWIHEDFCKRIIADFKEYKLKDTTYEYTYPMGASLDFKLIVTRVIESDQFRLEFSNNRNMDTLTATVDANSYDELLNNIRLYAGVINDISGIFAKHTDTFVDGMFTKCIRNKGFLNSSIGRAHSIYCGL